MKNKLIITKKTSGNVIPYKWFFAFTKNGKNKKPYAYLDAIFILAHIWYWYGSGNKEKKRFSGDILQMSANQLSDKLNISKAKVKAALAYLEAKGCINLKKGTAYVYDRVLTDVEFIDINMDAIQNMPTINVPPYLQDKLDKLKLLVPDFLYYKVTKHHKKSDPANLAAIVLLSDIIYQYRKTNETYTGFSCRYSYYSKNHNMHVDTIRSAAKLLRNLGYITTINTKKMEKGKTITIVNIRLQVTSIFSTTEQSIPDFSLDDVKKQIGYDNLILRFPDDHKFIEIICDTILHVMTDSVAKFPKELENISTKELKERFKKLNENCIIQAMEGLIKYQDDINDKNMYVFTTLYDLVTHTKKKGNNKKTNQFNNYKNSTPDDTIDEFADLFLYETNRKPSRRNEE